MSKISPRLHAAMRTVSAAADGFDRRLLDNASVTLSTHKRADTWHGRVRQNAAGFAKPAFYFGFAAAATPLLVTGTGSSVMLENSSNKVAVLGYGLLGLPEMAVMGASTALEQRGHGRAAGCLLGLAIGLRALALLGRVPLRGVACLVGGAAALTVGLLAASASLVGEALKPMAAALRLPGVLAGVGHGVAAGLRSAR